MSYKLRVLSRIVFTAFVSSSLLFASPSRAACYSVVKSSNEGELLSGVNKRLKAYGGGQAGKSEITLKCSNGKFFKVIKVGGNYFSVNGIWSSLDGAARAGCGCSRF